MAADNDNNLVLTVSSDMSAAERGIKKFVGDIATGSAQIEKQFQKMGRGIDNSMVSAMQTRIDKMVGIGTKGAQEWTGALADQGKELERLRARYNPLFATITNYKTSVNDIKRAHALGAISATEMATAIGKERQAALASTAAIKGRNAALKETPNRNGGGAFNTANLAAQFQDIGVTAAMGMSPLQIALQQGTQISAVLGPMGAAGAVKSLGAAFLSVINPVSLVTIGLVAASAAAIQYFGSMDWGGGKSEEALKKEAELIDAVVQKWGDALPALKAYNDERKRVADNQDIRDSAAAEADKQWVDLRKQVEELNVSFGDSISLLNQYGVEGEQVSVLSDAFAKLTGGISDGTAKSQDAKKVQDELLKLFRDTGIPVVGELAKLFDGLTVSIDKASGKAGVLIQQAEQLANASRGFAINSPAQDAYFDYLDEQKRKANQNPTVTNSDGRMIGVPTPGAKPIQLGEEPNKKAESAATKAANAYRDLIKSADDRIAQLRLETEIAGQYGTATDAARFRLDLLQQAEDKGRSLSEKQRAEIEGKVAAYEKYSQALAEAKLRQDLLDDARMSGMSKRDQEITQRLRSYGLSEDLGGANAGAIRSQLQQQELSNAGDKFIDNLTGALLSGGEDIGKKLGEVILSTLLESAKEQVSNILKQLFGALISGTAGASPIGAVASAASTFAAPVGAVSRSALPAMPAGDIASYIAKAAAARGIDPNVALRVAKSEGGLDSWNLQSGVMKNGVREPSFGPFQLYKGGGLGNDFMRKTGMDPALAQNGPAGVDFALDHASKNGWGAWYGAKNTGIGNFEGIGTGAESASAALEKLAGASTETTKGLGSLASSLTSGAAGGAGGLAGGFDWSSLFSSSFKPNTTLGAFLGAPGRATGGPVSKGQPYIVGEKRPELFIPNASGRIVARVEAPTLRPRASGGSGSANGPSMLNVNITGASGDPHVRELVRQGVAQALAEKNDNDRRGGVGAMQQRYASQKG